MADDDARWAIEAARAADAKSATDVVVLDVADVLAVCGQFVICSAGNPRLVRTIAEEVEATLNAEPELTHVRLAKDLAGHARVIHAQRKVKS